MDAERENRHAERENRLADLLLAALEQPTEEQLAFLDASCRDDPELLAEARRCLDLEGELDPVLERPGGLFLAPSDFTAAPAPGSVAPTVAGVPSTVVRPVGGGDADAWQQELGFNRLGLYRLVGLLGEGGMGQVYIGEDERLGRQVAVKILPPELAHRTDVLKRFEREARALAALNHPNIVTIHSIEEDRGIRFLTMERVTGRTLKERVAEGGLPAAEILDIAIDLTGALAAAHGRGVIHRDLKPANIMLSDDGRVKILDFGVAKLTSADPGLGSQVSYEGMVIGTMTFMSPEQLQGKVIDARSDLFSLGVMLFLMACGRHPFPATNRAELTSALLYQRPADVRTLRDDLDEELAALIHRCLEKAPERRPQSAEALHQALVELQQARLAEQILRSRPDRWLTATRALVALAAVLLLVLGFVALRGRFAVAPSEPAPEPAGAVAERPAPPVLAVLPFDNLTGDPELAWLADGIAELLITDLAQAPGLTLVASPALRRWMAEVGFDPSAELDLAATRRLAERGEIQLMVRGIYARVGDVLHLTGVLEDPRAGQVLRSAVFEGQGEASLFALVGKLGATVLAEVGAQRPDLGPATLEDATTSSLSAWRAYTAGQELYLIRSETEAAIHRMEEALAIDPDFALAAVAASKMHQSLGRSAEAQAYAQRAFEQVDQLPLRIRFEVEAGHFGAGWTTLGRAIETYSLAVKVYPEWSSWWNNLARRYAFFERYDEAREAFEQAIALGEGFWGDVYGLANLDAAGGEYERGYRRLRVALEATPEHWLLRYATAWHLTEWGRFAAARSLLDELAAERPENLRIPYARWRLAVLSDDFDDADRQARLLLAIDDPFARWRGHVALAQGALWRGRSRAALTHFADAVAGSVGADRALASCFKAELHLELGDFAGALEEARRARVDGGGQWPELAALGLAARAEIARGRPRAADAMLQGLRDHWRQQPNAVEERQLLRLTAARARARGDGAEALRALERAAALLPARGVEFSWHVFPDHVPLLVELGAAELAAGRAEHAVPWLARARQLGAERLEHPVAWVRGLYLGALAEEAAGSSETSRELRAQFLELWDGGDLEPEWLSEARGRIAAEAG